MLEQGTEQALPPQKVAVEAPENDDRYEHDRSDLYQDMDLAIASIALSLLGRPETCNKRHFSRIDDLELVDGSKSEQS